ncbi:hypothetical protein AAK938_01190 [Aerococcaceae bacterium 50-4]
MKKRTLKLLSIIIVFLFVSSIHGVKAEVMDTSGFDLNQVDDTSASIIEEMKNADYVYDYVENAEEITFYIQEPTSSEGNNSDVVLKTYGLRAANNRAGVTKVVWQKGFLNFKLYLSASTKTRISQLSAGAATTYLSSFLGDSRVINVVAGALGTQIPRGKTYTYGSVYVFKNGTYKYSYYQ